MTLQRRIVNTPPTAVEETNEWDRVATSRWGAYVSNIERRAITYAIDRLPGPGDALDLGCGAGRWSRVLADRGWRTVCTDVSAEALSICQHRVPSARCILRRPDERTLPSPPDSVRLLLCIEVPPVMQSEWFVRESARVLQPGGLLVAVCWNLLSVRGLFCHARAAFRPDADYYRTAYLSWRRTVTRRGFRVLREEGFCWFPFRRNSNSPFVRSATSFENLLGLRRLAPLSPWVVAVLQKQHDPANSLRHTAPA